MIVWIALYVIVQIGFGLWLSRSIRSSADFMVAGRSLGPTLLAAAVFATFFGAEAIVGTAGAVYEKGLSGAQADPLGYALALGLIGVLFAGRLRREGYVTFADFFRQRYSQRVEMLVVLILLPGSVFWAAAQLRAFGQIVGAAAGMPFLIALIVGAIVVVVYSALGGILADAWSDLLHGVVIVVGLLALLMAVLAAAGGTGAAFAHIPPERAQLLSWGEDGLSGFIERLAVPIFGTIVAVEVVSLILSSRSIQAARSGCIAGACLYLTIGAIPALIGLIGPAILPDVKEAEQIIPLLSEKLLSRFGYVLFVGAIVAAILSTVSTIFLASSSQVVHNLLKSLRPDLDDAEQLRAARATLVLLAAIATGLAVTSDNVKSLVEIASAAGSSGVFAVVVFGLFTNLGGERAAIAALLTGTASWAILSKVGATSMPYSAAIVIAIATYLAVARFETAARRLA